MLTQVFLRKLGGSWVQERAFIGLLAAVLASGAGCDSRETGPAAAPAAPATATSTGTTATAGSPPASEVSDPGYAKLVGRWQRTDAIYVIEVRTSDAATGRLEAAYLNPNPIHVAKAEATREAGKIKVFVELQDVGYPGSTYRLTYFPQTDQLYGVYFQAALGQSFDVEFARQR